MSHPALRTWVTTSSKIRFLPSDDLKSLFKFQKKQLKEEVKKKKKTGALKGSDSIPGGGRGRFPLMPKCRDPVTHCGQPRQPLTTHQSNRPLGEHPSPAPDAG